jgi:uroporphyrinogen-III decarboxylase
VLPGGTPAPVRAKVRRRLELLADGGLIFSPGHRIQPDAPTESILAMHQAAGGLR